MTDQLQPGPETETPVNPYSLLEAVNSSSDASHTAWMLFLGLMTYLMIAVAGVTHKDLLLETPVSLPLLQVSIQQAQFFQFAPVVLVLLHLGLVSQLVLLARKTLAFDRSVQSLEASDLRTHPLRLELHNFFFVQAVAGPHRSYVVSAFLHGMSWLSLVILPVVLLLFIQISYLPFHDPAVTWAHRVALLVDIGVLVLIGVFLTRAETSFILAFWRTTQDHPLTFLGTAGLLAAIAFFSLFVATIPGEPLDRMTGPVSWITGRNATSAAGLATSAPAAASSVGALQLLRARADGALFGMFHRNIVATDLDLVATPLAAEPETRRVFGRADGSGLAKEGDLLRQVELAAVIERMRQHGPGDFYNGPLARQIVAAVNNAGGSLTLEDLRSYVPVWRDPIAVEVLLGTTAYFAPPPAAAGAVAAEIAAMMASRDKAARNAEERPHLFAETAARAFGDRARWLKPDGTSDVSVRDLVAKARIEALMRSYDSAKHVPAANLDPAPIERPESPAATSFVVADREGQVVACALTMNNLFGTGRIAPGTGILLAALPGGGRGPTSLGPMIVHDKNAGSVIFAAGASGGVTAPTSLAWVASEIVYGDKNLENALASKRIHHGGHPDIVFHEPDVPETTLTTLKARGHQLAATPSLGKVNALFCPGGLLKKPETCQIRPDPRGFGLATSAR